ncbi:hypothetical protein AAVH_16152 [Aphelenchoides avenae]|nr:hypothetical protein AAVH_16152 [Aphelenchus avenae]
MEPAGPSASIWGKIKTMICVWIKALSELEADVHVRTFKLVKPSYNKMIMNAVCKLLDGVLHLQEYTVWKDCSANRGDELCVDVLKKAKRVSIMGYYLADDDD